MNLWETYKQSLASDSEEDLQNPMFNDRVFQAGLRALQSDQSRNSPTPPVEQPPCTQAFSSSTTSHADQFSSVQLEAPEEEQEARSANEAEDASPASDAHERQLQEPITTSADEIIASRLQTEREAIVRQVVDSLLPRIEQAAAEAAEREIDRLIESTSGETTREKIQAILVRVNELPEDDLENLFLRSEIMATALRTVLRRVELEEAVGQWEDLAPGG
ncbi:hypothetical protein E0Z10_g9516 [Xylaria hypoxylon]|uniref:Uncharacterized protein n=1 Tax=Xylaria hypoxylon TaxID=37992 RepID=A0A4Z0YH04_9PEZI|nr:hypothetical protein E0Z10_g9516 [Xylaria hypoxylon]